MNQLVNRRSLTAAAGICLIVGLLSAGLWWSANEEARTVRALPRDQRAPVFTRTLQNLRVLCEPAPPRSLRDHCRDQAGFILKFPECDDSCQEIARRHLTMPQR